jgi:hypothetical protein
VGRPHAMLWVALGHAVPHRSWAAQVTRTMLVGRQHGFRPMDGILNKNPFLFILNSIQTQTLKIHISLLRVLKIMKLVLLDS